MTSNAVTPPRQTAHQHIWQTLIEFNLSTEPGNERLAVVRVVEAVQRLNWSAAHLEQLKLALAQAARKAMERSCHYDPEAPLVIRVLIPEDDPATGEADQASGKPTEHQVAERGGQPVGRPPPRGWSFFFIEKALPGSGGAGWHHLDLFLYPGGK
jgi:hypothetical protein